MNYQQGTPREQLFFFTEKLDDIVSEESAVRFIDMYIDALDLHHLNFKIPQLKNGRPPYSPTLLIKIYLYSYFNKIRSSRKIQLECSRNMELIWLTQQLKPKYWVIAKFRNTNKEGLRNIFKEFLKTCHKLNLLSFAVSQPCCSLS